MHAGYCHPLLRPPHAQLYATMRLSWFPPALQVVLGITILYCALHVVFLGNSGMQDTDIPLLLVGFTFGARWDCPRVVTMLATFNPAVWLAAWHLVPAHSRPSPCHFVELVYTGAGDSR